MNGKTLSFTTLFVGIAIAGYGLLPNGRSTLPLSSLTLTAEKDYFSGKKNNGPLVVANPAQALRLAAITGHGSEGLPGRAVKGSYLPASVGLPGRAIKGGYLPASLGLPGRAIKGGYLPASVGLPGRAIKGGYLPASLGLPARAVKGSYVPGSQTQGDTRSKLIAQLSESYLPQPKIAMQN